MAWEIDYDAMNSPSPSLNQSNGDNSQSIPTMNSNQRLPVTLPTSGPGGENIDMNTMSSPGNWQLASSLNEGNQNSLGKNLFNAPFKIGADVSNAALNSVKNIPTLAESVFNAVPKIGKLAYEHPERFTQNLMGGLVEQGRNALTIPKAAANYAANRLHLLPYDVAHNVMSPPDITNKVNEIFGIGKPNALSGEAETRGLGRNALAATGVADIAPLLNPFSYTNAAMARGLSRAQNAAINRYGRHYNNVFNRAEGANLGTNLPETIPHLNLETAMRGEPATARVAMNEFTANPTTRTAHRFKSDLLGIQRRLEKRRTNQGVLTSGEADQLNAVNHAIRNIEDNMFTRPSGRRHGRIANQYRQIQQGYNRDVLPYTQSQSLQEYRRGDLLPEELIQSPEIQKGKFAARQLSSHPQIKIRKNVGKLLGYPGTLGLGAGLGALLGWLYNKGNQ